MTLIGFMRRGRRRREDGQSARLIAYAEWWLSKYGPQQQARRQIAAENEAIAREVANRVRLPT